MASVTIGTTRSRQVPHRIVILGARVALLTGLVAAWELLFRAHVMSTTILPSPFQVILAGAGLVTTPAFWTAVGSTMSSALIALVLATVVAVPVGLLLGASARVENATRVVLDIGRSFPVIALLPVLILILGATTRMEILVVFLGVLWPIMLQTIYGSRRLDPVVSDTVRSFQIPMGLRFTRVLLPAAAPFIATGIRVAASAAVLLSLAVEILGRTPGIGFELARAQANGRPELALAYLVFAGVLGVAVNALLGMLERRAIGWSTQAGRETL